jgi:hypothetical protein
MGLFDRRRNSSRASEGMQLPERVAGEADLLYGTQRFAEAAEKYSEAIDRIDTMCYAAQPASRIRTPALRDQAIFDGLNSALGAAMAMDPSFKQRASQIVELATAQLYRVSREPGVDPSMQAMYDQTIGKIQLTLRLG